MVPPGASCAVHGGVGASFTCSRCGTFACDDCAFSRTAGQPVCRACAAAGLAEPVPWERRKELGLIRAFWETTKLLLRAPTAFFRTPATEAGAMAPISYALVAYTLGQLVWNLVMLTGFALTSGVAGIALDEGAAGGMAAGYFLCILGVVIPLTLTQAPIQGLIALLGGGGLAHLTLRMMKCANAPFESTLRAVSYANAPYLLYAVPCLGPFIGWGFMITLEVKGLKATHRIGTDRAVVAVLAYRLVVAGLLVGAYVVLGGLMYALPWLTQNTH